eukprot:296554-Rhodomonas_salina.2
MSLSDKLQAMRAMRTKRDSEDFDGAIHIRGSRRKFDKDEKTGGPDFFGRCASEHIPITSTKSEHKTAVRRNSLESSNRVPRSGVQGIQAFLGHKKNLEAEFFVTDVPELEGSFERLGIDWKNSRTPSACSGCSAFSRMPSAFSTASTTEPICTETKGPRMCFQTCCIALK